MKTDDILNLMQYPWSWLFIAGSFVLLILGYYLVTWLMLRKKNTLQNVEPLPDGLSLVEKLSLIKNKYAEQVKTVDSEHKAGSISTRHVFQSLSVILRNFTHEYSQTNAQVMTLTDLEQTNSPYILKRQIKAIYPIAFERAEVEANVDLAVYDTLEVIQRWH